MSDDYWRQPSASGSDEKPSSFGKPTRAAGVSEASASPTRPVDSDETASRPAVNDLAAKAKGALGAAKDKASSAASKTGTAITAAAASATASAKEGAAASRPNRRTRKARLRLSRIDPWSVMKTSFLFGIAGGIILFMAVWVLWGVVGASGVFESVNKAVNDLLASPGGEQKFRLENYLNTNKILGFTAMIAAADVVIFTALATLFSFLYNLSATVLGGLEVTLAED